MVVNTSHSSTIQFLEWNGGSGVPMLLSADPHEKICLWSMQKNVNRWQCLKTLEVEGTVAVKWCTPKSPFRLNEDVVMEIGSFEEKYHFPMKGLKIPPGSNALIAVTASAMAHVCVEKSFAEDPWVVMSTKLQFPPKKLIAHADVQITSGGWINVYGAPSQGNSVYIWSLVVDMIGNTISSELLTRVNVGMPSTVSLLDKGFQVLHLAADPSSLFLCLMDQARSVCRLDRWELQQVELIDNSLGGQLQQQSKWVQVCSKVLGAEGSQEVVTCLRMSPNGKFFVLSYTNGVVEVRDSASLELLKEYPVGQESKTSGKRKASTQDTEFPPIKISKTGLQSEQAVAEGEDSPPPNLLEAEGQREATPVSLCFSPNGCCVALLWSTPAISVLHLPLEYLAPDVLSEVANSKYAARRFADLLELSVLRGTDPWDLVVVLCNQLIYDQDRATLLSWLMLFLQSDLLGLRAPFNDFYSPLIDNLRSRIYRCLQGHHVNYLDSQMRQSIVYVSRLYRSSLHPSIVQHVSSASSNGMSAASFAQIVEQEGPMQADTLAALLPLGQWVSDAASFLLRNLFHFVSSFSPTTQPLLFDVPEDTSASIYYPIYATATGIQVPGVWLLLEPQFLASLQEILLFALAITQMAQKVRLKPPSSLETLAKLHGLVSESNGACRAALEASPACAVNIEKFLSDVSEGLRVVFANGGLQEISLKDMGLLLYQLDLFPPHQGVLDSFQVSLADSEMWNGTANLSYNPTDTKVQWNHVDVLSKQPIHSVPSSIRQCTRCHRVTLVDDESHGWFSKLNLACPMCGGVWIKFLFPKGEL